VAAEPQALAPEAFGSEPGTRILDPAPDLGGSGGGLGWRVVTDRVMGGVSDARGDRRLHAGREALCLTGDVSLANNGGFVQLSADLAPGGGRLDGSAYGGVEVLVAGNGERYGLHLKTDDVTRPWQSYRAELTAGPWRTVRLPFAAFTPHRVAAPLDPGALRRVGLVAIGRAFRAELCVAGLALYGVPP
jgi:hypothetical protein